MLGRQILKSHFGKHYKIHLIKDGPVPRSLKPERFSSSHSVRQFLQGLQAPQSYWRGLAVYCDDAAPYRSHQRDYLCVVGNNVLSGRIRIYEVDLPDTHALAQSSAAIQDRQGYQYQFISMRQALASSSRSPQRFTSTQQVYETLYELAPNLEQLQALAADLQLTSSPQQQTYTQLMDVLAEGLAEQRVALYVTAPFKRPEAAGATLEAASNMPGNRKVELAPATRAARTESKAAPNKIPNESQEPNDGANSLVEADKAVIDPRKLTEYALNPDHPVGCHKARVFESALGFNRSNAGDLLAQVQQGVKNNPPVPGKIDQFGERFTVDIPVVGPKGEGVVTTGWIYKTGSSVPEMTTIMVKKK